MTWTPEQKAAHSARITKLWAEGRYDDRRKPKFGERRCFVCAKADYVRHFNLSIDTVKTTGIRGNRGAGAIDLCRQCWSDATRAAALRRRVARIAA